MALYEGHKLSSPFTFDIGSWTAPFVSRWSAFVAARSARLTKIAEIDLLRHCDAKQLQDLGVDVKALMGATPDIKRADPVDAGPDALPNRFEPSEYDRQSQLARPHVLRGQLYVDLGRPPL